MNSSIPQTVKVLLADDHKIVREGIRSCLVPYQLLQVVGEASDGAEAVRKAKELNPDVVVMDITMPGMNGLEATQLLRAEKPEVKVLVLTVHKNTEYVLGIMERGARGYLLKETSTEELVRAIESVAAGKSFFSSEVSGPVLDHMLTKGHETTHMVALSEREREVLKLVARGYSSKQIAVELHVTVRTAETHRERIMRKLDIHNVAGLTRFAISSGMIES
jgi:DNA-binding NarL/FixJ family response regulator